MNEFSVSLVTLESHNHIIGDIERGVKIFGHGCVEWEERGEKQFLGRVPHKDGSFKIATATFSEDGQDIAHHSCDCCWRSRGNPICRHVVALVLAVQGRIVETPLALGKTATASMVVAERDTARSMDSGNLNRLSMAILISLVERAACEALSGGLLETQTSIGTGVNMTISRASSIGSTVIATVAVESILGNDIKFSVSVSDNAGVVGTGLHTRKIVSTEE